VALRSLYYTMYVDMRLLMLFVTVPNYGIIFYFIIAIAYKAFLSA